MAEVPEFGTALLQGSVFKFSLADASIVTNVLTSNMFGKDSALSIMKALHAVGARFDLQPDSGKGYTEIGVSGVDVSQVQATGILSGIDDSKSAFVRS